jgi:hypothetical protein
MKTKTLIMLALVACVTSGRAQDAKASFDAGKRAGDAYGVWWAAGGAVGHPASGLMPNIADGQWRQHGQGDETAWKKGFLEGFEGGLTRGKAGEKAPIQAKDRAAYDAGFEAGYISAHLLGSVRSLMHTRCDEIVASRHYDKSSFDDGFVDGTAAADVKSRAGK